MLHFINALGPLAKLVLIIIAQFHSHAMLYSDGAIPNSPVPSHKPISIVNRLVLVPMDGTQYCTNIPELESIICNSVQQAVGMLLLL